MTPAVGDFKFAREGFATVIFHMKPYGFWSDTSNFDSDRAMRNSTVVVDLNLYLGIFRLHGLAFVILLLPLFSETFGAYYAERQQCEENAVEKAGRHIIWGGLISARADGIGRRGILIGVKSSIPLCHCGQSMCKACGVKSQHTTLGDVLRCVWQSLRGAYFREVLFPCGVELEKRQRSPTRRSVPRFRVR